MKYGIMGGFIRLAFAKTAFDYIEKELPEIDTRSYKRRGRKDCVRRSEGLYAESYGLRLCRDGTLVDEKRQVFAGGDCRILSGNSPS